MAKLDANGKPIEEYPKLLYLPNGKVVVNNEKEEAEALENDPLNGEKKEKPKKGGKPTEWGGQ